MKDYKQWSGKTRKQMSAKYKGAEDKPLIMDCEMCGQARNTMRHAEEYGPTKQDYFKSMHSLCGYCHAMLHLRFRFPNRWNDHKEDIRKYGVRPFVPNMGLVFLQSSHWVDVPYVKYEEGHSWWESLNTKRYAGEVK